MPVPQPSEAAPYYFTYIDRVKSADVVGELELQLAGTVDFLRSVSEAQSLHRYAPDKWTIREVLNHLTDSERVFALRALWFARQSDTPQPGFDQDPWVAASGANTIAWARHIEEFRAVRLATVAFFRNLPDEAWMRTGSANGNLCTVNALAYIIAGHVIHHRGIIEERYL